MKLCQVHWDNLKSMVTLMESAEKQGNQCYEKLMEQAGSRAQSRFGNELEDLKSCVVLEVSNISIHLTNMP